MKKISILFGFILLLVVVLFATNPNKQEHQEAIQYALSSYVNDTMAKEDESGFLSLLGSVFSTKISESILDSRLDVKDYYVCSVGYITIGSKEKKVSFGILRHVYTLDSNDIDKAVNHLLNEK